MSSIEELLTKIDMLLDGFDRSEDDPRGGWWQTSDGAKIGRIKLHELKKLIASHLAAPPAASVSRHDSNHHRRPTMTDLPPKNGHVLRLAEIIREVDGAHSLGASALAEAILAHPGSRWQPVEDIEIEVRSDQMAAAMSLIEQRIDFLRQALREVITICGGLATDEVSDAFLCGAPGEVRQLAHKADFGLRRLERLQREQRRFRDPERTILCDILANGTLLPDPDGKRYGVKRQQPTPALPSAQEMDALVDEMLFMQLPEGDGARLITRALELWGRQPAAPTRDELNDACGPGPTLEEIEDAVKHLDDAPRYGSPAFTPIPIDERLPGPEDCAPWKDEAGTGQWCWALQRGNKFPRGFIFEWVQIDIDFHKEDIYHQIYMDAFTTVRFHWAPWWAIPLPGGDHIGGAGNMVEQEVQPWTPATTSPASHLTAQ